MSIKVALLGSGTVGTEVARLLIEQRDVFAARAGDELELAGIAVRNIDADRDPIIDRGLLTNNAEELVDRADLVIELIGGIEPARTLILRALNGGTSVITGNKALLAEHGPEIYDAAAANNANIYFEAAVAGAIPVVYAVRESLAGDRVLAINGILNGTTNFILDEMTTKGLDYADVLAQAQELGYAEADPTADVDGFDAAAKIAILASLAFHTRLSLSDVDVQGIRNVTAEDIAVATDNGYVIKLIASAKLAGESGVDLQVGPAFVPLANPLANVAGSFNAVTIDAAAADRLMFYGRGAGGAPTASAVMSDVVAAAAKIVDGGNAPREIIYGDVKPHAGALSRYFLTLAVRDQLGTLSTVAKAFAESGVSIQAVRQGEQAGDGTQRVSITTHEASRANIDATIEALNTLDEVDHIVRLFRVEEV